MKFFIARILCCLVFFSCKNHDEKFANVDSNEYDSLSDTLYLPFDTTRVLSLYENFKPILLYDTTEVGISDDTFKLTYMAFACDCQSWVERDMYELSEFKGDQQYLDSFGYYLEPFDVQNKINSKLLHPYNQVVFYGKIISEYGWPSNPNFIEPNPPKGKVLSYSGYKVIKPINIYGPYYYMKTPEIPADISQSIGITKIRLE